MMTETEKDLTLEEGLKLLEEITLQLEKGEESLDRQFELYKKGIELAAFCNGKIDTVKKNMLLIDDEGNTIEAED